MRQCSSKCIARMWLFSLHHTDHAFANSAEISHMCVSRAPKRRSGGQSLREGFFVCVLGGAEGTTYTVVASLALVQHQGSHNFSDLFKKKFRVTYVFWNFETYKEFYAATLQFPFSPYSKRSCTISMNYNPHQGLPDKLYLFSDQSLCSTYFSYQTFI